ncbi:13556_t:CDS:2, partial [Entrophospora sp. SA101]
NLSRLAEKIKSHLVFAHVRASNSGALSETNCHPWQYESLMWMHNGHIQDFYKIKRKLVQSLKEDIFLFVQGNTDSEWAFALFLNQLSDPKNGPFSHEILRSAMLKTIQQLNIWAEEEGINEPSLLNFAVTDGCSVVCTRYINCQTREAASLYFSSGTSFMEYKPGHYKMFKADKREDIVLIASEPLTFEKTDWLTIPSNTCIVVTPKLNSNSNVFHSQLTAYTSHSQINKLSEAQISQILTKNKIITHGKNVPRPILSFTHCAMPQKLFENVQQAGYLNPTPIQMQAIPTILSGRDVLA